VKSLLVQANAEPSPARDVATFVSRARFARHDMALFVRSAAGGFTIRLQRDPNRRRRLVAKGENGQPIRVLVRRRGARAELVSGRALRTDPHAAGNRPKAQGWCRSPPVKNRRRYQAQFWRIRGDEPARSETSLQQSRRRQLTAQGADQRLVSDAVIKNTHL
jgi:hypothetical protein